MKTFDGYSKEKFSDTSVLLAGGGSKELSNFIGTLNWDSTNRKLQYKKIGDTNWRDLVTFGSNATNSTAYLPLSGGTMTGLLTTTSGGSHKGIKVGNTYINAINGDLIFQNNIAIRFGGDSWDYNVWAGLKYVHSSKIIYLGLADGSAFTANSAQSGGKLYLPGIANIYTGNGTNLVWHKGNDGSGSGLDADLLDGVHANGLFTAFSNAGSLTTRITIGGVTKDLKIDADTVDGYHANSFLLRGRMTNPSNGTSYHGAIPYVIALKAAGTPIYTDPEFATGTNSISVYNNSSNGTVTISRIADNLGSANSSGYILQISTTSGTASPGRGGFIQSINSRQNAVFAQIFRAKIPTGFSVGDAQNHMGNGYTTYWLTDTAGTGKWEWYIRITICGNGGNYYDGGHVYLSGSGGVTWYLSYCNLIDLTKGNYDGLRTKYSDYATQLQTARTIWGQSFNGTANVSGTLSGVANILFNADNTYDIGSNSAASRYIYTYWLGAKSGLKLELGANNSGYGLGLCIDTNLNVGIGTNSPSQKLHINGNAIATNFGVNSTAGSGQGISLYNGSGHVNTYGIAFVTTGNWGTHGYVTADWATYFTMSNTNNRGWIFKRNGSGNVFSIDTSGLVYANGRINGNYYTSRVATGTLPYACTSTTLNTNLNADLLDGYHASSLITWSGALFDKPNVSWSNAANGVKIYSHYSSNSLGYYRAILQCKAPDNAIGLEFNAYWCVNPSDSASNNNIYYRVKRDSASDWGPYTKLLLSDGNATITGSYYANSDIRYKLIQSLLLNKVNSIAELPIFTYYWNDNLHDNKLHIGSSAQAVNEILPELVTYDESKDFYNLDYATLGTIAGITACKELVKHEDELTKLKQRVLELEELINQLKNK